jgi:rhamnosyltransferase
MSGTFNLQAGLRYLGPSDVCSSDHSHAQCRPHLDGLLPALAKQSLQPDEVLVVDSSSSDATVARFREYGAWVEVIAASQFNHGGTRRWASEQIKAEVLIYMTQDSIPADGSVRISVCKAVEC